MGGTNFVAEFADKLRSEELAAIARVTDRVVWELQLYAREHGFTQIMPVMLSPFTDPLNHAVYPANIDYEGRRLKLTASMIFHKQLALNLHGIDRIFIVSPNIRLEKAVVKSSSNHLLEFSQFDLEIKNADMHQAMGFLDGLLRHVFSTVRAECSADLRALDRRLPEFDKPFPIYSSDELRETYGEDFEKEISQRSATPVFITNFKREFYDRETPGVRGKYNNFDLIYPEGFGEGLSGAEREFEYEQILYRMKELDMELGAFERYLDAAKQGVIPRTAGGGIGIQRLVKFICGRRNIRDVCLFDRSIESEFVF
jgi:asparaginyl-tRNA synthetase